MQPVNEIFQSRVQVSTDRFAADTKLTFCVVYTPVDESGRRRQRPKRLCAQVEVQSSTEPSGNHIAVNANHSALFAHGCVRVGGRLHKHTKTCARHHNNRECHQPMRERAFIDEVFLKNFVKNFAKISLISFSRPSN